MGNFAINSLWVRVIYYEVRIKISDIVGVYRVLKISIFKRLLKTVSWMSLCMYLLILNNYPHNILFKVNFLKNIPFIKSSYDIHSHGTCKVVLLKLIFGILYNSHYTDPSRMYNTRSDASSAVVSRQQSISDTYEQLMKLAKVHYSIIVQLFYYVLCTYVCV